AEKLSAALQAQRRVPVVIERNPVSQSYVLKVGPLANRGDAESLTNDLHSSGYDKVIIVESCPPGITDCDPDRPSSSLKD
ncbi:MAG TPA: hypothetical protein VJS64_02665, partial [Pyrinomonadaceae bacterium]|nr:hypothetical protein [Pyrinomonadaceae bacterium]